MKKHLTLFLLGFSFFIQAQIRGVVTDTKDNPLPFVSIYLENSVTGTTTNNNGEYDLNIHKTGDYTIVFQFLGYKTQKKKVSITSFPYHLNIKLGTEQITLEEVSINSKVNPAHAIIRNAIKSKDTNTDKLASYTANFYSRGLYKIKNAPKKILGQEVGDLGGGLDSTRSGIVYLSETVSKIKFQKKPKQFNEHIIASKVSGEDNGVSFNQADEVNFNFYENSFNLAEGAMISPIADGAFSYYNYKLLGDFYDKNGKQVNKIQVSPKRKNDRVFNGYIYITENDWAIYGVDVTTTGAQVGVPFIKELKIKQDFNFIPAKKSWVLITQTIDFDAGILGFNFNGRFSAAYSNYNLSPNFTTKSFSNEVLSFAKNALEKDTSYWNTLRPIALTKEEVKDYKFKDSIKTIRKSKKYLDSIDLKNNKFKIWNILTGYSYDNTYKKWGVGFDSPITNISFNTVQGWNSSVGLYYYKRINDKGKRFSINTNINYGVSEKKWRPTASFYYKWNNTTKPILYITGGVTTQQFNTKNPISPFWNTLSSVLFERNYMKIYEKTFARIAFSQEVTNGVHLYSSLEYADRKPLFNTTDYVMFPQSNVVYTSNNPQNPNDFTTGFTPHKMYTFNIGTTIQFGQKYWSYPNSKINIGNKKYPSLFIGYRKNFGSGNSKWNSDVIHSRIAQDISLSNWGEFKYRLKGGMFLAQKDIPFMDYAHFNGNRLLIAPNNNYVNGFLALPYYALSSNDKYAEAHAEYNFKGALLSKVPLLNKLNFHLVTGAKGLFTSGNKPYSEFSVGLDNIGVGKWRFLRVDFVRSNLNGIGENRIMFGLKL